MHRLGQAGMAVHVVRSAITKQYRNDDPKKVCTPPYGTSYMCTRTKEFPV